MTAFTCQKAMQRQLFIQCLQGKQQRLAHIHAAPARSSQIGPPQFGFDQERGFDLGPRQVDTTQLELAQTDAGQDRAKTLRVAGQPGRVRGAPRTRRSSAREDAKQRAWLKPVRAKT